MIKRWMLNRWLPLAVGACCLCCIALISFRLAANRRGVGANERRVEKWLVFSNGELLLSEQSGGATSRDDQPLVMSFNESFGDRPRAGSEGDDDDDEGARDASRKRRRSSGSASQAASGGDEESAMMAAAVTATATIDGATIGASGRRDRAGVAPQQQSGGSSGDSGASQLERRTRRRKRRLSRLERKPILNEFSFPANLVQGMRFVLMCQVLDGELPVQIKWFKDERELVPSSGDQQPTGAFGQDSLAAPHQASMRVAPATLPGADQSSGEQSPPDSEQVELVLNDELGSSLLFRRVQQQHSGNYTCLASNQFGSASYSSTMSVKVAPKWKVEPRDQHSIMGEQITIDCQATGNPNPFIRWKFAAGGIQPQSPTGPFSEQLAASGANNQLAATNFKLINSNHHVQTLENGSLAIRQANKEHEGLYLCEADNGVEPSLVKVLRLVVHVQAHFADEIQALDAAHRPLPLAPVATSHSPSPQVSTSPGGAQPLPAPAAPAHPTTSGAVAAKSVLAAQNSSQVRLVCQPLGDLPLTIDWLKDGQLIYTHTASLAEPVSHSSASHHQQLQLQPQQQQVVGSPVFGDAQQQASGRYHVSARRNNNNNNNSGGLETGRARANSGADGVESELVITSVRRPDAGLFSCLARNAHGQAERRLRLLVQEPPEAPEVVDVAHIGSRSIALRWLAPFDGNSPIQRYIVEYKRQPSTSMVSDPNHADQSVSSGELAVGHSEKIMPLKSESQLMQLAVVQEAIDSQQQQHQQQKQIQHTIHDLEPLTRYSMRVVAVNALGKSRASVALSLRTEEEVPSVVPSLVEALALSSKSIKLRWTITYSPEHEIIDGFFVGYRSLVNPNSQPAGGAGAAAASSSAASSKQQQATSGSGAELPTFTYKTIRLTNQRPASGSAGTEQQQQRASGAEMGEHFNSYLSPVSSVTKNLVASGLVNPFGANQHHQQQQTQVVVVSAFEYVIGGLERDTEYTILIQCFNKKGAGPTSDPAVFRTFSSDPPEKLALIAEEITESSVHLSWRFLLGIHEQSGDAQVSQHSASAKEQLLGEQVDGFVLTFAKLAASQQRGIAKQQPSDHRSAPARHLAPEQLSIQQQQQPQPVNRSQFGPPAPSADQWQAIQLAPQQRRHQLRSLECGTSYAMKIWAFNKVGQGEPSEMLVVSTRGKAPVAPDRRSFIAINSTQVRLHLSAWYDGGCEIDKFQVQYRVYGQSEWLLVSSNIPREQVSLSIRELAPATSYELLASAENQVGATEARYRFATLDAEGRQVPFVGRSGAGGGSSSSSSFFFLGSSPTLDSEGAELADEYMDSDGSSASTTRRVADPSLLDSAKWLTVFRRMLSSPTALAGSLLLFVAFLSLLLVYKFNSTMSTASNATLASSTASSSTLHKANGNHRMSAATTLTCDQANHNNNASHMLGCTELHHQHHPGSMTDCVTEAPPSINGNGSSSLTDSPATSRPPLASSTMGNYNSATECHYSFPVAQCTGSQQPASYGQCGAFAAPDGAGQPMIGYGQVTDQQQQQQRCLVQMLIMESQQQQRRRLESTQEDQEGERMSVAVGGSCQPTSNYSAAITTLARNQFKQRPSSYELPASATLGRHPMLDYQSRIQQHQQLIASSNGHTAMFAR